MDSIDIKTEDLRVHPDNPRSITEERFLLLCESIQDFPEMLLVRPLVANEKLQVIGGNMRLRAAQHLGIPTMPVNVVDWDEDRQREFMIKDNAAFGAFDWETIANCWTHLPLVQWGLPVWEMSEEESVEEEQESESKTIELVLQFSSESERSNFSSGAGIILDEENKTRIVLKYPF